MADIEFSPGVTLYCRKFEEGCQARPLVPENWRTRIIKMYHQFAHSGPKITLERVKGRYYWPTLTKDVTEFVRKCLPCQAVKSQAAIKPPVARP